MAGMLAGVTAAVVFVGFWISYGLGWWYALIVMHAWHARVRQLA